MKQVFLILMIAVWSIFAFAYTPVKYVRRVFDADTAMLLSVNSMYGKIGIQQWDRDSIVVEATFGCNEAESWEIGVLEDDVDLTTESWPGIVKVSTQFSREMEDAENIEVRMQLYLPEYIRTEIMNRYGEIHIPSYNAREDVVLSAVYGDIRIDSICSAPDAEVRLNVSYGKLDIKNCANANIRSAYSSVGVAKSRYLHIKAEKSRINIEAADTVISEGQFNVYKIKD